MEFEKHQEECTLCKEDDYEPYIEYDHQLDDELYDSYTS
jgi:hypothetical protein